jgi:hypothetical protein
MLKRRNHGLSHSYQADHVNPRDPGELVKLPGVTTILRQMPKNALVMWSAGTVADKAIDNWDELGRLKPSQRRKTLLKAPNEDRDAGARRGTQVHALAAELIHGRPVDVPEFLTGHVEAYLQFLHKWDPEPVATELVVVNRELRYCGTADLIADMRDETWLLDLKTSRSGVFDEDALQTLGYARAETYALATDPDGAERPLADLGITRRGVVHIRYDGFEVYPTDIEDEGYLWAYLERLAWLHHNQREQDRPWIGPALDA